MSLIERLNEIKWKKVSIVGKEYGLIITKGSSPNDIIIDVGDDCFTVRDGTIYAISKLIWIDGNV